MNEITVDKTPKTISKKKTKILVFVILGVFLIVIGVIVGSYILPKNITGAWELIENPELSASSYDEVPEEDKVFYVFDKPDKYGKGEYHTCYQGGVECFNYELLEEDSVEKINLGTENMEYKITGSKLLGNAKLTIIYPEHTDEMTGLNTEASEYVFTQAKNPSYDKQNFEEYETDASLYGTWTNNERTLNYYQYTYTYEQGVEFKDNGIMIIHYNSADLMLNRRMYYAYTIKDSELAFSPVTDKETKYVVSYDFDESGNLIFKNDSTQDSIFADAFFGNFTFYSAENLSGVSTAYAN